MVEGISEHAYISVQEAINWLREKGILDQIIQAIRGANRPLALVICERFYNRGLCQQIFNWL